MTAIPLSIRSTARRNASPIISSGPLQLLATLLAAASLLALTAQVVLPLPFTPVPIVLTCTLAALYGPLLGPKMATLAILTYLAEGALGAPVFSAGGAGLVHLFGPTGGYLAGYLPGALLSYALYYRLGAGSLSLLISLFIGHFPIYLLGSLWLSLFVGFKFTLIAGLIPFLPGNFLVCLLLSSCLPTPRSV